MRKDGTHWFFSGCDVSGFVAERAWTSGRIPRDVFVSRFTSEEHTRYLNRIADRLLHSQPSDFSVEECPFDTFVPEYLTSFVSEPSLDPRVFEECQDWIEAQEYAGLSLYGTVDLSANDSSDSRWKESYEFGHPDSQGNLVMKGPFVEIKVSTPDDRENKARITVYADSTIWLRHPEEVRNAHALGGRMTPGLGDEFLSRLIGLCRTIATSNRDKIIYSSFGIGDSFLRYDGERIRNAFTNGLQDLNLPWHDI
jgi:hypothetical protein